MEKLNKLLGITARKSQVYYGNELADLDISTGQYMFIVSICENAGLSQEELGEKIGINKSTVAKVIAQLKQDGYVVREVDELDKRGYKLYPTEKAKDVYPKIVEILDQWKEYLVMGLTDEEITTLLTLMTKVESNARKYSKINRRNKDEFK
ncbi:MarR family winged helix-turn-helix transcriptional regulator [Anaerosporobacter faecicola]|uniref:MarR family winged helix-turn-helix transcriptional regulator n=1 Tax=Anaerosporobacter faecicola TaxID=2718714 RepID=UPI00143B9A52|nr:MarR family transcriptional regulator [Anaerosporobacter faecicola]